MDFNIGTMMQLIHGDCLEKMKDIPDKSIDMILCDLPYGTTQNKWDSVIPFEPLWEQYKRIAKPHCAIVLYAQSLFACKLALSNESWFRYDLVWKKGERVSGHLDCKKKPLRNHEQILVFYKEQPKYTPQMVLGKKAHSRGKGNLKTNNNYGKFAGSVGDTPNGDMKYPKSILDFDRPHPPIHPTQKSVELGEWLIKTFTEVGDIVLDNTMGSGTHGISCLNTEREFIGIESDPIIFELAKNRINNHLTSVEPDNGNTVAD